MAKVLVVEDEADLRLLVQLTLETEGHELLLADDGASGLERASSDQPDVVLLDVMMPGIDGWTVLQELAARDIEVPVVMMSARTAPEDILRALSLGAVDYLTKPFRSSELVAVVAKTLASDASERERRRQARIASINASTGE